jgi:CRISPR-associated endonuclease Csn1
VKYRLGLDVGTNSLGWAILKLDRQNNPVSIEKIGVRVFTDGRSNDGKTTLAAHRRQKRLERRMRQRFIRRKKTVLNQLVRMKLFPSTIQEQLALKNIDVLTLRSRAVEQPLSAFELGRVFYHLNMKRGFRSNRREKLDEDVKNKISERIESLRQQIDKENVRSVGQFLYRRYEQGLSTKSVIENNFHLSRELIESEFDAIVEFQKKNFSEISDADWLALRRRIFYQRPLKPIATGPCSLYGKDGKSFRAHKFYPSFEEFRFLVELYNLSYLDEQFQPVLLSSEQVIDVFKKFKYSTKVTFSQLKRHLNLGSVLFAYEKSASRKEIKVSSTNEHFYEILGDRWSNLSLQDRDLITGICFSEDAREIKSSKLKSLNKLELTEMELAEITDLERLPMPTEGACQYSLRALQDIVALTISEGLRPDSVIADLESNESLEQGLGNTLEYYGKVLSDSTQPVPEHVKVNGSNIDPMEREYGRLTNPTVHSAMNQIRHVVNELFSEYGKPYSIHIELARDLKRSKNERDLIIRKQRENQALNEKIRKFIQQKKAKPTAFNFERVKLWFELSIAGKKTCVYSGKNISASMVLSDQVEVDHILPFSKTLDDGLSNKVLVLASENRIKKNRTPYEAFHSDDEKWAQIQERVKFLPVSKQSRFAPDALRRFSEENAFLERHLNDTRYISKLARKYFESVLDGSKIVVSRGQITSLIRRKLGLSQFGSDADGVKDRDDHRHHAIDAIAVAIVSRSFLNEVAVLSSRGKGVNRIKAPTPWRSFIRDVRNSYNNLIVSRKLDHAKEGPLLEETAYGIRVDSRGKVQRVTSKRLLDDKTKNVRRKEIKNTSEPFEMVGSLESYMAKISHTSKDGRIHTKVYDKGEINHLAVWYLPRHITLNQDGNKSRSSDYLFVAVRNFDLNVRDHLDFRPHPAAKLVGRFYKGDTVILEHEKEKRLYVIKTIKSSLSNSVLQFLSVERARPSKTHKEFSSAFSKLIVYKFRKVHVSPAGKIYDPGPILK